MSYGACGFVGGRFPATDIFWAWSDPILQFGAGLRADHARDSDCKIRPHNQSLSRRVPADSVFAGPERIGHHCDWVLYDSECLAFGEHHRIALIKYTTVPRMPRLAVIGEEGQTNEQRKANNILDKIIVEEYGYPMPDTTIMASVRAVF